MASFAASGRGSTWSGKRGRSVAGGAVLVAQSGSVMGGECFGGSEWLRLFVDRIVLGQFAAL